MRHLVFLCWKKCSSFFNLQTITSLLFHTGFGTLSKQEWSFLGTGAKERSEGQTRDWRLAEVFPLFCSPRRWAPLVWGGTWVAGGHSPWPGVREQQAAAVQRADCKKPSMRQLEVKGSLPVPFWYKIRKFRSDRGFFRVTYTKAKFRGFINQSDAKFKLWILSRVLAGIKAHWWKKYYGHFYTYLLSVFYIYFIVC